MIAGVSKVGHMCNLLCNPVAAARQQGRQGKHAGMIVVSVHCCVRAARKVCSLV
jgi:hypothetical protein